MSRPTSNAIKMLIIGIPLAVAIEHFSHEMQPTASGNSIPGYDHIAGPALHDMSSREWNRGSAEPLLAYISRITKTVHYATYHCEPDDNRLSWIENIANKTAKFLGYDSAYEIGLFRLSKLKCGYCSERAAAATAILRKNGINASTYGLGGHVITRVVSGDAIYFTDPDYGVGPFLANLDLAKTEEIYKYSVLPSNAKLVATIIKKSSGGAPYYSEEYFESLRRLRNLIHYISTAAASLLTALSLLFTWHFYTPKFLLRNKVAARPSPNQ
ncbi:hypothetical protein [Ectopseudomonas composti]|uniref:hypothetical protein n=1 Tax=Ectopseudomonas composti TaxID=658457 RepID=UPI00103F7E38|nr:hypothetical protein [Pseudomonas composti]